ncbi:MAG: TRAP transporter small permease [Spirochaetota bacterium]
MRILKWLDEHFEEWALVILLVAISLTLLLQIIMRYIFNSSLSWSEEFARYCFVWSTLLSIGYSIKRGSMLRIDIVVQFLPKSWRKTIDIIMEFIVIGFFAFLLYYAFDVVKRIIKSGQTSPALGLPMVVVYVSLIVGFSLACIRGIQKVMLLLHRGSKPDAINTGRM